MYSAFNYLNDIVLLKMLAQLFLFSVDDSPLVAVMIFVQNFTIFFFEKGKPY